MFRSIIAPVEHGRASDRGVATAAALARHASLELQLVTVCDPAADCIVVESELHMRARRAFPVPSTATILPSVDVAGTLVTTFAQRPSGLVVLGTRALAAAGELVLGGVAEALLVRSDRPILLAGPNVDPEREPVPGRLIVGIAGEASVDALVPVVAEWWTTFGGGVTLVHVDPEPRERDDAWRQDALDLQLAGKSLADVGVDASVRMLRGADRTSAMLANAEMLGGAILAVATQRWADPARIHWSSVARRLVHRSPFPVLVVPVHRA